MKKLLFVLSISIGIIFNGYSQQVAAVQKATPVVTVQNPEKPAESAKADASHEHGKCAGDKSCCKGKKGKACCKGKDAKSCHAKEGNAATNSAAPHNCASHKAAATGDAAKPACCAGKKDGSSCAHHQHGHGQPSKEESK
jgi:hypothetical protein